MQVSFFSVENQSMLAENDIKTRYWMNYLQIFFSFFFSLLFLFIILLGHYIPQLAELMLQYNKKHKLFNLQGIAVSIVCHTIWTSNCKQFSFPKSVWWLGCFFFWLFHQWQLGNPVLEFATDFNSRAEFIWSHGLISDSTYRMFTSSCNYSRFVGEYYRGSVSPICSKVMSQVSKETSRFVDKYDVTLDVCISSVFAQSKVLNPQVCVCVCGLSLVYTSIRHQLCLHPIF